MAAQPCLGCLVGSFRTASDTYISPTQAITASGGWIYPRCPRSDNGCGQGAHLSRPVRRFDLKVEIQKLRKEYDNGVVGLKGADLTITDGVFALLGPNGAGKSTLMSILATLIDPSDGTALIDGHDVRHEKDAIRQLLGYLPQDFGLYP